MYKLGYFGIIYRESLSSFSFPYTLSLFSLIDTTQQLCHQGGLPQHATNTKWIHPVGELSQLFRMVRTAKDGIRQEQGREIAGE